MAKFIITIIGDVMIDINCDMGGNEFQMIDRQFFMYGSVNMDIGGTGVGIATACAGKFKKINLLCRLSSDPFAKFILDYLKSNSVNVIYTVDNTAPTGLVLKLTETATSKKVRLMVGSSISASQNLQVKDINLHANHIIKADIFATDGYCLVNQPRKSATLHAMKIAKTNKVPIAFDLVPHNAHKIFHTSQVEEFIDLSDIVISEVGTIRHSLLLSKENETYTKDLAEDTLGILQSRFPNKTFLLRYGIHNMSDNSLIAFPKQPHKHVYNGYSKSNNQKGFGDRLAVSDILEYLVLRSK